MDVTVLHTRQYRSKQPRSDGVLFDIYLSCSLSFPLAGVAGLLNLIAIGVMMRRCLSARGQPQPVAATAAT